MSTGLHYTNHNLGSMIRAALWLSTKIGEGNTFTKDDLRKAFPDAAQIDRRVRDLRAYGWRFDTSREDPTLATQELRLVTIGAPVWDPAERRAAYSIKAIKATPALTEPDHSRIRIEEIERSADPDAVRTQVAALPHDDKVLVLAWLVKGRRDHTPAEQAFEAAQSLAPEARQALMTELADDLVGRIKETPKMTD